MSAVVPEAREGAVPEAREGAVPKACRSAAPEAREGAAPQAHGVVGPTLLLEEQRGHHHITCGGAVREARR
jgi:hypothetical protein